MESGMLSFVTRTGLGRTEREGESEATVGEVGEWYRAGIGEWIARSEIGETGFVVGSSGEARSGMACAISIGAHRSEGDVERWGVRRSNGAVDDSGQVQGGYEESKSGEDELVQELETRDE